MPDLTLSFDNGPDAETTPLVLDVLARRAIRTTFFVIGEKLARAENRRIAERAHAEGHWIGNHTWSHSVPLGERDPASAVEEIERAQSAIGALAHPARYFRPYGGGGNLDKRLLNPAAVEFLVRSRHTCVLWNAIPRDWQDPQGWVERALDQCRSQSWTLIVLHDLPTGAMLRLDRFLGRALDDDLRIRQDFPPDCMPIVDGRIVQPLEAYVASA